MTEKLKIDSIAYRGDGIARAADGRVWFTPGVCDGEIVIAEAVTEKKSFAKGRLVAVSEPSRERLANAECSLADGTPSPGCVYGHAAYAAELRWKQEQLLSFLSRQARVENAAEILREPFASPKRLNYRNKITLHFAPQKRLGYVADDNETVIDIPQCPLAAPQINEALAEFRDDNAFWRWVSREGGVVLRYTAKDGALVVTRDTPELTERSPLLGELRVPATGFYQVNPEVGDALSEYAAGIATAKNPSTILDFYCGVGVFGLAVAKKIGTGDSLSVNGWDTGADVIRAANENARRLGFDEQVKFRNSSMKSAMNDGCLARLGRALSETVAIVDPPRAGLEPETVRAIAENPPSCLIYISCAPDTLARDLRALTESGRYNIISAKLFDMFPRTAHFESCVVLENSGK